VCVWCVLCVCVCVWCLYGVCVVFVWCVWCGVCVCVCVWWCVGVCLSQWNCKNSCRLAFPHHYFGLFLLRRIWSIPTLLSTLYNVARGNLSNIVWNLLAFAAVGDQILGQCVFTCNIKEVLNTELSTTLFLIHINTSRLSHRIKMIFFTSTNRPNKLPLLMGRNFIMYENRVPVPVAGGLRRRSTAARLLRLWVRISPGEWMSVCCECCVLSGRGLWDQLITRPEETCRLWCVVVCDIETSRMRTPWPALGRSAKKWKESNLVSPAPCSSRYGCECVANHANHVIAFSRWMSLIKLYVIYCRFQWLRGLRCETGAASLLGLRVRISPETCSFVCSECCVLLDRGLCDGPITRPKKSWPVWWVWVSPRNHSDEVAYDQ